MAEKKEDYVTEESRELFKGFDQIAQGYHGSDVCMAVGLLVAKLMTCRAPGVDPQAVIDSVVAVAATELLDGDGYGFRDKVENG